MTATYMAFSLLVWLCLVLLSVSRRSRSALWWYRVASLGAVVAAVSTGVPAWIAVGLVWLVVKVFAVPAVLSRRLPDAAYGALTQGTPMLALGAAAILGVFWWALGESGIAVGALASAVWLSASRHEVWLQALLLLTAEISVGMLALASAAQAPGVPEVLAALEVAFLGVLLAWLQKRGTNLHQGPPSADRLTELRG